jgi:multicomponent Na+:H+ antiporter subunit D
MDGSPGLLSPALLLIFGAALVPYLPGKLRSVYMLALPVLGFFWFLALPDGDVSSITYLGIELVPIRIDGWTRLFGYVFFLATFISVIYSLHVKDTMQQVAGLIYAGGAIGAVLAGDYLTLFVYWEVTAVASVFLVWASRTERAYRCGMRYVTMQLLSGVLLLIGALVLYADSGSLRFELVGLESTGGYIILLAMGIKCAFPLLHNWLQDAYPEATVTGTVFLSAFTTKLAIYALARGFAGTEELIWIGATMTAFPIFYAVIENDLRRVLAYSLNNQLGFMVVGIGIGTELALNGTAAHAFCHILYKALLFMSIGAVLLRTGTANGSSLGGLYKSMPWTTAFCIIGAASISAFPLFSGFVSKSLIISAVAIEGHYIVWGILLFASAGVFHHSGIKIPYFAFFAHDSGIRCQEAPKNMLVAMAIAAAFCIGVGVFPSGLYAILPFDVDYTPYTAAHVLTQMQLLGFSALAFSVLMWHHIYPPELPSVNLDTDWFYRRLAPHFIGQMREFLRGIGRHLEADQARVGRDVTAWSDRYFGAQGELSRARGTSTMVMWVAVLLGTSLVLFYLH